MSALKVVERTGSYSERRTELCQSQNSLHAPLHLLCAELSQQHSYERLEVGGEQVMLDRVKACDQRDAGFHRVWPDD